MDTNPTILDTSPSLYDKLPPDLKAVAKGPEFQLRLAHTFYALTKQGPAMPADRRLHMSTPAGNDAWLAVVTAKEHGQRPRESMPDSRAAGLLVTVSIPVPSGLDTDALVGGLLGAFNPAAAFTLSVVRTLFGALGATSAPPQRDERCIDVTAVGNDGLATWQLLEMQPGTADG